MNLSAIRFALDSMNGAAPKGPVRDSGWASPPTFLLGEASTTGQRQAPLPAWVFDLAHPAAYAPELIEDFTQDEALEIDYPRGEAAPVVTLHYSVERRATEVRLDGTVAVLVRMAEGAGPLRASAIKLMPDLAMSAGPDWA